MPVFAVHYSYVDDPDLVTEHRPAHRDFLRGSARAGHRARRRRLHRRDRPVLCWCSAGTRVEEIESLLRDDPFQRLGLVQDCHDQNLGSGDGTLGGLTVPPNRHRGRPS